MPITQSRIMSLINAAQDYRQAFQAAIDLIRHENEAIAAKRQTTAGALYNLTIMISEKGMLTNYGASSSIIDIEKAHFKSHARRNAKRAEKEAAKRGKRYQQPPKSPFLEIPEARTTAPSTIARQDKLTGSIYQYIQAENKAEAKAQTEEELAPAKATNPYDPIEADFGSDLGLPVAPRPTPIKSTLSPELRAEIEAQALADEELEQLQQQVLSKLSQIPDLD